MIVRKAVFCLVLVLIELNTCQNLDNQIPNVESTLTALYPNGFRATISVDANVKILLFDGILYGSTENAAYSENAMGQIWGTATKQAQGGWLFEDHNVTLKVGQAIRYAIFFTVANPIVAVEGGGVSLKFDGTLTDYNIFEVEGLENLATVERIPNCLASLTKVRGKETCAGQIIFEDNFDTLREDWWRIEQYIPIDHPEYPFVSYQKLKSNPRVFVSNGNLNIVPRLQEDILSISFDQSIFSGFLNLTNGCTRKRCFKQAFGSDILPPVVSGRMTSTAFAFTYGTIHVRAKLPQGDWLYPEILIEPLVKKYGGQNDILNILKIAVAGGNRDIADEMFGNKVLKGGPVMNKWCQNVLTSYKRLGNGFWSDDFHVYSLRWTPEEIVLYVDDNQYLRIALSSSGADLSTLCLSGIIPDQFRSNNTYSFEDYYQITLGVAAGGIAEFPDTLTTGNGKPKPWRNHGQKASLMFYQDRESWFPTWTQPGLIIDYIKVVAL